MVYFTQIQEKRVTKDSIIEIVQINPLCKGVIISEIGHSVSLANLELFHYIIESWIRNTAFPKEVQVMN